VVFLAAVSRSYPGSAEAKTGRSCALHEADNHLQRGDDHGSGVTIEFRCSPAVSGDLMDQQDAFSEAVRPRAKAFVFLDLG
jgi:hypothetical protein